MSSILELVSSSGDQIKGWAEWLSGIMAGAGVLIRNFGSFWTILQLKVGAFVSNCIAWIETLPANFGIVFEWLKKNWWNLLVDWSNLFLTFTTNLLTNAKALGTAIWDAIQGKGFSFR